MRAAGLRRASYARLASGPHATQTARRDVHQQFQQPQRVLSCCAHRLLAAAVEGPFSHRSAASYSRGFNTACDPSPTSSPTGPSRTQETTVDPSRTGEDSSGVAELLSRYHGIAPHSSKPRGRKQPGSQRSTISKQSASRPIDGRASFMRHGRGQRKNMSQEAWDRSKFDRNTYTQWGYLRHQYSDAELRSVRRAFNSWKSKFSKILHATDSPCPWLESGKWIYEHDTVAEMKSAWQSLDVDDRAKQWPLVMLSTLRTYPEKASMVLDSTLDPLPPGYAIHDVILFLARYQSLDKVKGVRERTIKAEEFLELLSKLLSLPRRHVPFSQRSFGLFAKRLPGDQAQELYDILKKSEIKLHPNTLVQFASKLSGEPAHKNTAFGIMQDLVEQGVDLNEARPSSVITSLLHCKANQGGPQQSDKFSPKDALQYFIEKGFTLNVVTSTAFLDSLCQHGEVEEAIRLALLFAESGVQLDAKAWATVFRGAKTSMRVENVTKALDVAKVANVPYLDVLNNSLHAAFYFAEMEVREKRTPVDASPALFSSLLRIYAKKFDLEPLQWWLPDSLPLVLAQANNTDEHLHGQLQQVRWGFESSIMPFVDGLYSSGDETKIQPSLTTIAIMMRAYIRSLQQPYDLMSFYQFFKARLDEQSHDSALPSASRLVKNQGSLIHDTFIMAMTEHRGLSRPALQVFGDMLKDQIRTNTPEKARVEGDGTVATSPIHPAPTVMTFTILLRGLLNPRDRMLAEQVVQVMREHGVEPNLVTWNTLTRGYATMQNIPKTVSTLQDMETAGLKPDNFTFKAFGKLRDQERALKIMEGMINMNRQKIVQEELYE